jgi:1-acyl-sn-glycerol-3-phosphate acyltransferase
LFLHLSQPSGRLPFVKSGVSAFFLRSEPFLPLNSPRMSDAFYRRCQIVSRLLFNGGARVQVEGLENFPTTGPGLFVANHISHFDPNLLGMYSPRPIDYMATRELFEIPIAGWMMRGCNAFMVDRSKDADRKAIRTTLQRLEQGRIVGLFPEGGIRFGAGSIVGGQPLPSGTASLVALAKVPVLPGLIIGSDQLYQWQQWIRRPRLFIAFGPLLHFGPEIPRDEIARHVAEALRQLYQDLVQRHALTTLELPMSAQERWAQE